MFRQPEGQLKHPFIVPGSVYGNQLWDWDCWLTNVALRQFVEEDISVYERGCVINPGFQNWNLLSLNMQACLKKQKVVEEF